MTEAEARPPRVLLTGFGRFPGVPVNPSALMIEALAGRPGDLAAFGEVRVETLRVDYAALVPHLDAIARAFRPEIAIHFGVSAKSREIAVETLGRNRVAPDRPDQAGRSPGTATILAGAPDLPATLPVSAIAAALGEAGLPARLSDDAGDYLCNFALFWSLSGRCGAFAPAMAGFVHVPPLAAAGGDGTFRLADLTRAALIALRVSAAAWRAGMRENERAAPGSAALKG